MILNSNISKQKIKSSFIVSELITRNNIIKSEVDDDVEIIDINDESGTDKKTIAVEKLVDVPEVKVEPKKVESKPKEKVSLKEIDDKLLFK